MPKVLAKAKRNQLGHGTEDVPSGTNNVATEVLKKAKTHQEGRVAKNATTVTTSLLNKVPRILEKAKQHQEGRGTSQVPNGTK